MLQRSHKIHFQTVPFVIITSTRLISLSHASVQSYSLTNLSQPPVKYMTPEIVLANGASGVSSDGTNLVYVRSHSTTSVSIRFIPEVGNTAPATPMKLSATGLDFCGQISAYKISPRGVVAVVNSNSIWATGESMVPRCVFKTDADIHSLDVMDNSILISTHKWTTIVENGRIQFEYEGSSFAVFAGRTDYIATVSDEKISYISCNSQEVISQYSFGSPASSTQLYPLSDSITLVKRDASYFLIEICGDELHCRGKFLFPGFVDACVEGNMMYVVRDVKNGDVIIDEYRIMMHDEPEEEEKMGEDVMMIEMDVEERKQDDAGKANMQMVPAPNSPIVNAGVQARAFAFPSPHLNPFWGGPIISVGMASHFFPTQSLVATSAMACGASAGQSLVQSRIQPQVVSANQSSTSAPSLVQQSADSGASSRGSQPRMTYQQKINMQAMNLLQVNSETIRHSTVVAKGSNKVAEKATDTAKEGLATTERVLKMIRGDVSGNN